MTRPTLARLGAACGIVFPIGLFLAVGNGNSFAPWRAVAATWALVLALPFLAYLYSLLRAAEDEGGWLSTLALVAGVSGILLKLTSDAPEFAIHRNGIAKGSQLYKALDNSAGAATLMSLYPLAICCAAVAVIALRQRVLPRWLGIFAAVTGVSTRRQRRLRLRELRASAAALSPLDARHQHRPAPPDIRRNRTRRLLDVATATGAAAPHKRPPDSPRTPPPRVAGTAAVAKHA